MNEEILYEIALTQLNGVGVLHAKTLMDHFGSAKALWETPDDELRAIGSVGNLLTDGKLRAEALRRAEQEMKFIDKKNIDVIPFTSPQYPYRLKQCEDAPVTLFRCGRCPLDQPKMVAMVGTRHATDYGMAMASEIVRGIAEIDKDVVIVSGLAYGIDIASHRAAMKYGLQTIGVVAHGLDMIYPNLHRPEAAEIANGKGAILTEFLSNTQPIGPNFLQRNRIVAGLCQAVIVVESDYRGGSLSTARLAMDYGRDVFAVPGRLSDRFSTGCNNLISENRAGIFISAEDFIKRMGWMPEEPKQPVQPELDFDIPIDLPPEKKRVVDLLRERGEMQINEIAAVIDIPFVDLVGIMTELEFDDVITQKPGDIYLLPHKIQ